MLGITPQSEIPPKNWNKLFEKSIFYSFNIYLPRKIRPCRLFIDLYFVYWFIYHLQMKKVFFFTGNVLPFGLNVPYVLFFHFFYYITAITCRVLDCRVYLDTVAPCVKYFYRVTTVTYKPRSVLMNLSEIGVYNQKMNELSAYANLLIIIYMNLFELALDKTHEMILCCRLNTPSVPRTYIHTRHNGTWQFNMTKSGGILRRTWGVCESSAILCRRNLNLLLLVGTTCKSIE